MTRAIPNRLPAQHMDKGIIAMSTAFVQQIHLRVDFAEHIDVDRMARAMRLCTDAEPILGCRYVGRWFRPYWQRFSDEQLDQYPLLQIEDGDQENRQAAFYGFLGHWVEYGENPQFSALLLRESDRDSLIVKVNHQVVDAGGTKELGYLIAGMYRELGENADFKPTSNFGSRGVWQVFQQVLPGSFFKLLWLNAKQTIGNSVPYQSISFPSGLEKKGEPIFVFKRFDRQRVAAIKAYGQKRSATINDIIAAALMRAYIRSAGWDGKRQLRMGGTVDLRRYLPEKRGAALCNLSSFYFTNLGLDPGDSFDETLGKIKGQIDHAKQNLIGLPFLFGMILIAVPYPEFFMKWLIGWLFQFSTRKGNLPPSMTNLGPILRDQLDFGSPEVSRAEIYVPPVCPPFFVTGISSFKGALAFSVGFFESALQRKKAEEVFEFVDEELPR